MAYTLLSNLVNPEVMADMMDKKLVNKIVFAPLAVVDNNLTAAPGDTLTMPQYSYIGDASVLAEASALTMSALTATTASATVKKYANGVEITDEAALSGYGDPIGEATEQLAISIASKIDSEMLSVLNAITGDMLFETASTATDVAVTDISDAQELFGEDIDAYEKVVLVSPKLYNAIRKTNNWLPASEISAEKLVRGAVGEIYGCQIIVSNKLKADGAMGNAYIVMPGALRLILKRETLVESDRDITRFTTIITASKHAVCYLYDTTKAVKIAKKSA